MKLLAIFLLCLLLLSCTERNPKNPFDPRVNPNAWAPTNLNARTLSPTSVSLTWNDNCSIESGFHIERKNGLNNFSLIATLTANNVQYTDTSLIYDTLYTYRVRAYADEICSDYTSNVNWSSIPENFVLVLGGTFNNGTSDVILDKFYIDKYELTQSAFQAVMGYNPSTWQQSGRPVEKVSWFNAIEYCNRRSINEGLTPCYSYLNYGINPVNWPSGWNTIDANRANIACFWTAKGYRLTTEMEWQYAARGGNKTHSYTFSGSNTIDSVAWYRSNSGMTTHKVGTMKANELWLFDMSGNVWEWIWDIYGSYPSGLQNSPHGAISGESMVIRGGSMSASQQNCTVAIRDSMTATQIKNNLGFRLCISSP